MITSLPATTGPIRCPEPDGAPATCYAHIESQSKHRWKVAHTATITNQTKCPTYCKKASSTQIRCLRSQPDMAPGKKYASAENEQRQVKTVTLSMIIRRALTAPRQPVRQTSVRVFVLTDGRRNPRDPRPRIPFKPTSSHENRPFIDSVIE